MADKKDTELEREETITDLDVPEGDAGDVKGGQTDVIKVMGNTKWGDIELKRGQ